MKKSIFLFIFLIYCIAIYASHTFVTTASAINNGSWIAGDTIIMKNGTWTNQTILFKATGTADQPVVLMAETPGSVILNGTSKLGFSGKYVEINSLYFKDGTLSGSDVISFRKSGTDVAENCRLTNTTIENYNPTLNTVDSKWVSLYGLNNKVDHCSFINKNNSGTLLVIWLTSGVTVNHIISDNYFGYRNSNLDSSGNELNGQEIIRVGDSSTSMTTASCIVSGNFFEKCNGEIEVISNKSCGNLYTNNLFLECHGMLTLRHGNNCTVNGNYFFGNGVTESGGVRVIGENHKVFNNYFDNLRGTDYRSGICIVRGKENSALNEYFQVKNAMIEFNTFVNCSQAFSINYNSSSSLTMAPIGTVIAHNHVYNTTLSSRKNVNISTVNIAAMDVTWKNNLMNQGTYSNFTYTISQIVTGQDAKMALAGTIINMFEPSAGSALENYSTSENDDVLYDIRGRARNSTKLPGASQVNGEISRFMPVKSQVGSSFYNNPTSDTKNIQSIHSINVKTINNRLVINSIHAGKILILDSSGKIIYQKTVKFGTSEIKIENQGIYLIVFETDSGNKFSQKIIIN